jgi:hypothetical protein
MMTIESRSRRLLDVMRMDIYGTKFIGAATVGAFHAPLEWAGVHGEASNISARAPSLSGPNSLRSPSKLPCSPTSASFHELPI